MSTRRSFIKNISLAPASLILPTILSADNNYSTPYKEGLIISTWDFGAKANEKAWEIISKGGKAVDAVENGVKEIENDPNNTSVGLGGFPDRDGIVTLDAAIMDEKGNAGSVCALQRIKNPISVARKVMDETPHVILVSEGAQKFAISKGFKLEKQKRSTVSDKAWKEWLKKSEYKPIINFEMHDTIGQLAMDKNGDISGACTTSGLAFKMHGRVGDSPIIGAGLYVDNEVGAATSSGLGEYVLKTLGSFLIVELMRFGYSPQAACEEAVKRITKKYPYREFQVGFIAMNKAGETGTFSIHPGFEFAQCRAGVVTNVKAGSFL
ncbi:MAG: N(4)-(beta-N-acetylglucosaminyl)-L-asparaginase [Saprospiraceae bacterium]|jgi:N4-(beta-N-acetylglucosaminyl)-L-asparaginase|nr:N(4)-(beta-N-acetylglucosaminyl)-L-asparaginase [Saprospiraceae bacterium]